MEVTFAYFGEEIASSRLRALIPLKELFKLGVKLGNDVIVYGKDWLTDNDLKKYGKRVYDVCDNHFDLDSKSAYYRKHVELADAVTCNSEVMRKIIKDKTGRDAIVIKEPYESDEGRPDIGSKLLWYGHKNNIHDIARLAPKLKQPLLILSNFNGYPEWSPDSFNRAISSPCVVVIPTGVSQAKSENRMVESIRRGRYVCAEYLPSYEPFDQFYPLGDIPEHLEIILDDPAYAITQIALAQEYIRERYSPATIGQHWYEVLKHAIDLRGSTDSSGQPAAHHGVKRHLAGPDHYRGEANI